MARGTVERLMADLDLHGVIRGKPIRTTDQDKGIPRRLINGLYKAEVIHRRGAVATP